MYFDRIAREFDNPRRVARAREIAARIAEAMEGCQGEPVMEYGCGTGLISFCLADRFSDITLMDSSRGMIEETRRKIESTGMTHLRAVQFDMSAAVYDKAPFAAIFSSMVLHHIPDTGAILRALYGALRPGGILAIVELETDDGTFHAREPEYTGHHGFAPEAFAGQMRAAGFERVRTDSIYHGYKPVGEKQHPYSLFCAVGIRE